MIGGLLGIGEEEGCDHDWKEVNSYAESFYMGGFYQSTPLYSKEEEDENHIYATERIVHELECEHCPETKTRESEGDEYRIEMTRVESGES